MKICPVCDRPAGELVGQDDVFMCPRCAAAVEVEPSLRHLDAGSWKEAAPRPGNRLRLGTLPAIGLAAVVGILFLSAFWWLFGRSSPPRQPPAPPPAVEKAPTAGPEPFEEKAGEMRERPSIPPSDPPPSAPPPEAESARKAPPAPPPSLRERAREMGEEASRRVAALAGTSRGAAGDVRKRLEQAVEIERQLAQAALMAPDLPDLACTQGKLLAALGRLDEAHAAYGRALEADRDRLEALVAQGWVLVTAQLVAEAEQGPYPRTASAFRKRIADRYGGGALVPTWNRAADQLRKAFQAVARGEFEAALARLDELPGESCPEWLAKEIPSFHAALEALSPSGGAVDRPFRRGPRGRREFTFVEGEDLAWMRLVQFIRKRRARRPFPMAALPGRSLHAAVLRIDAALLVEGGKTDEALEVLDLAAAAHGNDIFVRLDRAGALARLGRKDAAVREYDAALALAAGLSGAAVEEIASLRGRVR